METSEAHLPEKASEPRHRQSHGPSFVPQADLPTMSDPTDDHEHSRLQEVSRYTPRLFYFEDAPPEATGLAIDSFAQGYITFCSMFLGPALLQLANESARSHCDQDDDAVCSEVRVHGFKPSSILTNIAIGAGLLAAFILPVVGAIVDHSRYRKQVGAISAAGLAFVKAIETMVSLPTWFIVAMLQVLSALLYNIHVSATYAYTSELSRCPSEQTKYNTHFNIMYYVSTTLFTVTVMVTSMLLGVGNVGTARISQVLSSSTAAVSFWVAWTFFFRNRPALSEVPPGMSLLTCGFRKIAHTARRIQRELPELKYFMLSIMCLSSATSALVTVSTTYMSELLEMDANEIGLVFLSALLAGVPGCKLGEYVTMRLDPLTSFKICDVFFVVVTVAAVLCMKGPEQKHWALLFCFLWGIALGWISPLQDTVFMTIIPSGQETELMGMYIFIKQVLGWLPPLVFTVLNENGFSISIGLASLNLYVLIAVGFLFCMGTYDSALSAVREQHEADSDAGTAVGVQLPSKKAGYVSLNQEPVI